MSLKNIIYIDYEKVYSLSSQLFEGLVQTATKSNELTFNESEALILKERTSESSGGDKNSLSTVINPHDYNYLRFEKELESKGLLLDVISDKVDISTLLTSRFVRIKASINLIDYSRLKHTTKNFNKIGFAINYVSKHDEMQTIECAIKSSNGAIKKKLNDTKSKLVDEIKEKSMHQQKDYFEYLSQILEYGYGDDVEITQRVGDLSATSFFIKDFFKIPLEMFIKRYSRKTLKEFTIVGMVTQVSREDQNTAGEPMPADNLRIAARNMSDALYDLESTFCTPLSDEIFIEPIALYTEI